MSRIHYQPSFVCRVVRGQRRRQETQAPQCIGH
uniref:Uncharacterized protein n=1 Tax=Triticum urartu TaxID=4572 RepID=A0A8R7QSC2_TRIUA